VDLIDQAAIQFRGSLATASAGTTIGSIKFTWYIRFHGRTRAAGGQIVKPKQPLLGEDKENLEPQASEMSYAELQAQVASMMGNRKQ